MSNYRIIASYENRDVAITDVASARKALQTVSSVRCDAGVVATLLVIWNGRVIDQAELERHVENEQSQDGLY